MDLRYVRLGNFDAGGRLDIAASGLGVWTYASNGTGGFLPVRRYGVSGPLAVAELTGGGGLDLVAGPSLLSGDGTGSFAAQRTYPMPAGVLTGVTADFDRDGRMDVAVVDSGGAVSVLRGNGLGGFGPPASTLTGTDPRDLATADFDRDGWPDLAVAHAGTHDVVVLRNDHAGGFTRRSYPLGSTPQSLAVADFGGDGVADIAVADDAVGAVLVLHGLPDGSFVLTGSTAVGTGSLALAAGNFNADVRADLAWFRAPGASTVGTDILPGTGNETFVPAPPIGLYAAEHALIVADVNGDGRQDLLGCGDHQPYPQVSGLGVRLGDGQGGFGPPGVQPPVELQSLVARDFTHDGVPDVAAFESSTTDLGVHLLRGNGDGSFGLFGEAPIPVAGSGRVVLSADFDNDGRMDVAALVAQGNTLTVLLGRDATTGADLKVSVQGTPDPAAAGQTVHYVATAMNQGPLAASSVRLRFRVPIGMSYVGHAPGLPLCVQAGARDLPARQPGRGRAVRAGGGRHHRPQRGRSAVWLGRRARWRRRDGAQRQLHLVRDHHSPVDLAITVTDTPDPVSSGQVFRYTMKVENQGAFTATRVFAVAHLPGGVTLSDLPSPSCVSFDNITVICGINAFFPGQSASFDIDVQAGTFTSVSLTADVDADQLDVDLSDNVAVEETRMSLNVRGELAHGSEWRTVFPAASPSTESYLVQVPPRSAFEVVLDEVSGDVTPVALERLGADASTVLQFGVAVGTGSARALRWQNTAGQAVTQMVRVRSQGCATDCGPDDTYRLRAYEASASFARFNTTGDQQAVVVAQNTGASPLNGTLWFWSSTGSLLASRPFGLGPHASLVLNVTTLVPGSAGTITVTHDGGYGVLAGKAVAIEPATGVSFDTPLTVRPR